MAYWLFQVMYDYYPSSWPPMLEHRVAAQNYPPGWKGEQRAIDLLKRIHVGDHVLAAFGSYRFAGYGIPPGFAPPSRGPRRRR
jgi:hypothetical protein